MKYLYCFSLILIASSLFGDDALIAQKWLERLSATSDLEALFEADSIAYDWPEIKANNHIDYLDDKRLKANLTLLAFTFMEKLDAYDSQIPVEYSTLKDTVTFYSNIADRFEMSGGYSNYVLADSLRRLALSRIVYALVANPGNVDDITDLFSLLKDKQLTARFFSKLNKEEIVTKENPRGVSLSDNREDNITEFYFYFERDTESMERLYALRIDLFSTSALLREVSMPNLVYRVAFTDMITQCHISGLIYFFRNGGQLDDINLSDVTVFKEIMGSSVTLFSDPGMGINSLSAGHLNVLIKHYKNPENYRKDTLSALAF